jgi:hypothetical protein
MLVSPPSLKPHISPSCLGTIPVELSQLSELQQLYLYENQLTGLLSGNTPHRHLDFPDFCALSLQGAFLRVWDS